MIKFLKLVFEFYVNSNLHVAFAVACLTMSVGFLFGVTVYQEAVLLMSATFIAYHMIRFFNQHQYKKQHLLAPFNRQFKNAIKLFIVFFLLSGFWGVLQLTMLQLCCLFLLMSITLFYICSFIKLKGYYYSIRFVPVVKIFVIAFVWSGAVLFLPLISLVTFNSSHILYFFGLVLFVIVLTIPFDIRDFAFDDKRIKTLPMLLGLLGVKIFGVMCLAISLLIHIFVFNTFGFWQFFVVCVLLLFLLLFSKQGQPKFYASFWVESLPILYYLLLIVT